MPRREGRGRARSRACGSWLALLLRRRRGDGRGEEAARGGGVGRAVVHEASGSVATRDREGLESAVQVRELASARKRLDGDGRGRREEELELERALEPLALIGRGRHRTARGRIDRDVEAGRRVRYPE